MTNTIRTHVIPAPGRSKADSAVFAYTKRGRGFRKVRVSAWMPYGQAVERFSRLEAYHARIVQTPEAAPLGAGGGPVIYLAVRSKEDPNWNGAARATITKRLQPQGRKLRAALRAI